MRVAEPIQTGIELGGEKAVSGHSEANEEDVASGRSLAVNRSSGEQTTQVCCACRVARVFVAGPWSLCDVTQ